MTIAVSIFGQDGTVLSSDTEETLPDAYRGRGEKIHVISPLDSTSWTAAMAGAGDLDFILMARDFIKEKIEASSQATDAEILAAIRAAIHEIWRDYATYSQTPISLKLLIATYSSDKQRKLRVVADNAIRDGRFVKAIGIGDAVFRSLADRYLGSLVRITNWIEVFVIFAMQQTKQSVPGCGGSTRIVTMKANGELIWKNPYEIVEMQRFFADLEHIVSNFILAGDVDNDPEAETKKFMRAMYGGLIKSRKDLVKNLERVRREKRPWIRPTSF